MKLLLDENLSPITEIFLHEEFGFDIKRISYKKNGRWSNSKVVKFAKQEGRVILTFDLDFGEAVALNKKKVNGIIVLRLADQRPENTNKVLKSFFNKFTSSEIKNKFFIVTEKKIRVRSL